MRVRLLGPLELEAGNAGLGPRDRVVLSALAVRPGESLSAEQLADALWGEDQPATWTKVVHGCVSRLRRALGQQAIETRSGYRLCTDVVDLDRDDFEDLVLRGRQEASAGSPETAAALFGRALTLWRGRPFDELVDWLPGRLEATRLTELRFNVQEDLLQARLDAGEHHEVAAEGTVLVGEQPWRERRWEILALAQYRCGRQAEALASIRTARRSLNRELGLDLGSGLVALERSILGQDPGLAADHEARAVRSSCPWKGLTPYSLEDRDGFFGRASEIVAIGARLDRSPLLVLSGPSGSGKSSLMNAGLAPTLMRRGHRVASFTPGGDGPASMAAARAAVGGQPILLIDQFEELFTGGMTAAAVSAWLAELAAYAATTAPVVLTLRADQLAHVTLEPSFARLAEVGMHLVAPLSGEALRESIEEPANWAGLRLEHGLTDLLLRDAEHQPGALPLLSHALTETWQRREGKLLTVAGYRDSGGMRGAVAASADRVYESLSVPERSVLRGLLIRMVTLSDAGEPIRTGIPHETVADDPRRLRVMDLLVQARMVTSDAASYEVGHEALVRAWPRLRSWLDEDAAGQRIGRHLAVAALGWQSLGRVDSELYQGARLEGALEWAGGDGVDLTSLEEEFLAASTGRAQTELRLLEERAADQSRQNRRLRSLLATGAALLLVAVGAGLFAVDRGGAARHERDSARAAELVAQHEALVGRSLTLRGTNRAVAALLAVEAYRSQPDALADSALLGTFTESPGFLGYRRVPFGEVANADLIPGTMKAVIASGTRIAVIDLETGKAGAEFANEMPPETTYSQVRVSADGRRVAQLLVAGRDRGYCESYDALLEDNGFDCSTLLVYDTRTGGLLAGPILTPFTGGDVAINRDGSLVAVTGGLNGDVTVWNVSSGEQSSVVKGLPRPDGIFLYRDTGAVVFDRRGHLFLGSMAGPVRELDVRSMREIRRFDAPLMSSHNTLVITRSGMLLVAGQRGQAAFDLASGRQLWTVDSGAVDAEPCAFFTVAEAVDRFYCGNYFGLVEERDLADGQRTGVHLDPQLGTVGDIFVADHGRELVAFSYVAAVYSRWGLDGTGLAGRMVARGQKAVAGYDPSGDLLVTAPRDGPGRSQILDAHTGQRVSRLPMDGPVTWLSRSTLAVLGDAPGLVDVTSGEFRYSLALSDETGAVFSEPDGAHAWAAGRETNDGTSTITRFRVADGEQTADPAFTVNGYVQLVTPTPDGHSVIVTWQGGPHFSNTRFDVSTGEEEQSGLSDQARVVFAGDGLIVGTTLDGEVAEFSAVTLQQVASMPGARGAATSLQVSTDGSRVMITAPDQTVQIEDVASRARVGDPLSSAALNGTLEGWLRPDGRAVAVNGRYGVVEWSLDSDELAQSACTLAGRNLTRTEWNTYVGADEVYRRTCLEFS